MAEYQKMYLHLFNAVSDALQEVEAASYEAAMTRLKTAQIVCEEIYLDTAEDMIEDY